MRAIASLCLLAAAVLSSPATANHEPCRPAEAVIAEMEQHPNYAGHTILNEVQAKVAAGIYNALPRLVRGQGRRRNDDRRERRQALQPHGRPGAPLADAEAHDPRRDVLIRYARSPGVSSDHIQRCARLRLVRRRAEATRSRKAVAISPLAGKAVRLGTRIEATQQGIAEIKTLIHTRHAATPPM